MTEEQLRVMVENIIEDEKIFIYDILIKPGNVFQIFLDGEEGLGINSIASINRKLYKKIEEIEAYSDGNFSIEVSSPGVDMPLLQKRQYHKHLGRTLLIKLNDDTEEEGKLLEMDDEQITIEKIIDLKKKTKEQKVISFDNIKNATVQIQF